MDRGDQLAEELCKDEESNESRWEEPLMRRQMFEGPSLLWEFHTSFKAVLDTWAVKQLGERREDEIVYENRREEQPRG